MERKKRPRKPLRETNQGAKDKNNTARKRKRQGTSGYGEHKLAYQKYPPKTAILSHVPSRSVCPWDMKK